MTTFDIPQVFAAWKVILHFKAIFLNGSMIVPMLSQKGYFEF